LQRPPTTTEQNTAAPPTSYGGGYTFTTAICIIAPSNVNSPNITGWVRFDQATAGSPTTVTAMVYGLPLNTTHGFHIHQWGDMSLPDSTSTGSHFTGQVWDINATHSIPTSGLPSHIGDMGNLYFFDSNGVAYYNNTFNTFGLYGSINNVIGRGIIVHQNPDDCTQPLGNAGARQGVCVIGPANSAFLNLHQTPVGLIIPSEQNVFACPLITTGFVQGSYASVMVPSIVATLFAFVMALF